MSTGYLCDIEVNLCYSNPCGSNGTCVSHEGGYTCKCQEGFTGKDCIVYSHHHCCFVVCVCVCVCPDYILFEYLIMVTFTIICANNLASVMCTKLPDLGKKSTDEIYV